MLGRARGPGISAEIPGNGSRIIVSRYRETRNNARQTKRVSAACGRKISRASQRKARGPGCDRQRQMLSGFVQ